MALFHITDRVNNGVWQVPHAAMRKLAAAVKRRIDVEQEYPSPEMADKLPIVASLPSAMRSQSASRIAKAKACVLRSPSTLNRQWINTISPFARKRQSAGIMLEESHLAANSAPCLSRRAAIIARLCKLLRPDGQRDERGAGCRLCPCVEPEVECASVLGRQQAVLKFYREQAE